MHLQLSSIQHVGIPVTNLGRSVLFYKSLGFTTVLESSFMHLGEMGRVVMMKSGDIIMELYQLPESALSEIRERKTGHIDHIAFDVADIDAAFSELREGGFTIFEPAPVFLAFWEHGCKYFNVEGPDGERLEFNQRLKR